MRKKTDTLLRSPAVVCVATILLLCLCMLTGCSSTDVFLENVRIAGVDVGGMTQSQAIKAVQDATKDTYSQKEMVVTIVDQQLTIPQSTSCVSLNAKAAVKNAYAQYRCEAGADVGADGVDADILPYLSIDQDAIVQAVEDTSARIRDTLTEYTWEVKGTCAAPDSTSDESHVLLITLGTPRQIPVAEDITQQILNAYNINVFEMDAVCELQSPAAPDLQYILDQVSKKPVDAVMDPQTFTVSEEVYGCGFDLEKAAEAVGLADPGETVEITMEAIEPQVTAQALSSVLYRDVLSTYTAVASSNADRNVNLSLACKAINGMILYPGDVFSYNNALGERTTEKGYKAGASYSGNETVYTVGGGICQVSSTVYYCALNADLQIVERYCHSFATGYMPLGMDATVNWGTLDFKFRNNTAYPIRIEASSEGGSVTVSLIGTDERDYYVKMEHQVVRTYPYSTSYQVMPSDNAKGYEDGEIITTPYTGYDVNTYRCKYSKETDSLISRDFEDLSDYNKRDKVVCKIQDPAPVPAPTESPATEPENVQTPAPSTPNDGGISEDGGGALPPV